MNTTTITTMLEKKIKRAKDNYSEARETLLERIKDGHGATGISSAMERFAQREGELQALTKVAHWVAKGVDFHRVMAEAAMESPDDSWSGRGNDTKRAINDGKLAALRDLFSSSL